MQTPSGTNDTEPARPRRIYRRAAERRGEIIAAAQEAFIRSNFSGARTKDIAEAAGVNHATLFKHFPSKEQLFEEAVVKPLVEAMAGMHGRVEVYRKAGNPAEMGKLAEDSTIRHLEDMQRIFPLLVAALFSDLERGQVLFRDHLEPLLRQRGSVLKPLVREGIEPEFVGLAAFGMMFAVAMQNWFGAQSLDVAEAADQLNRLATSGFARTS